MHLLRLRMLLSGNPFNVQTSSAAFMCIFSFSSSRHQLWSFSKRLWDWELEICCIITRREQLMASLYYWQIFFQARKKAKVFATVTEWCHEHHWEVGLWNSKCICARSNKVNHWWSRNLRDFWWMKLMIEHWATCWCHSHAVRRVLQHIQTAFLTFFFSLYSANSYAVTWK